MSDPKPSRKAFELCEKLGKTTRGEAEELFADLLFDLIDKPGETIESWQHAGHVLDAMAGAIDAICKLDESAKLVLDASIAEILDEES